MKADMRKHASLVVVLLAWSPVAVGQLSCRSKPGFDSISLSGGQLDASQTPGASANTAALPDDPTARLEALVRANLDAELALRPTMGSWLGDHGYDDKLDDVRTDAQLREASRLRVLGEQLRALPEEKLQRAGRLDRKLLLRRTEAALHELSEMRPLERSPLFYVDIAQAGIDSLVVDARVGDPSMGADTLRSLNGRLWRIRGLFDEARRNLRGSAPELSVRRAIDNAQALRAFLAETLPHLVAAVPDARLVDDARAASGDAGRALDEFAGWLQRDFLPRAHGDLALGPARFWERMRLQEAMPGSIDVLLPRVEAALRDSSRRADDAARALSVAPPLAPKPDPQHVVEEDHFRADELAAKTQLLIDQLATWGHETALLPVPPTGLPRVMEMPPQVFGLMQLQAIAPLEKHPDRPPVAYLEPAQRASSEKARTELVRMLNRPTLLMMLTHDLLGHFLISVARRQAPTLMQRVSASLLLDEGFAQYVELMLVTDSPFAADPKVRFVVAHAERLRLVRLLASIRFHAQAAKLDDIVRLFSDEGDVDDAQARREAERIALDPFAGAEALGRLEIDRLRLDWEAANPSATLATFHAALLSHGGTPLELIRDALLGN